MGRITAQLMFTSASLVFFALAHQGLGDTDTFRLLAIALGSTLFVTGTLTSFRVANASQEDFMFVKGMNRLRAAYLTIDPTLEPYFITGVTDDVVGIGQTYTMGPRRTASQAAASAAMFILVVNTIVAVGLTVLIAWPLGGWVAGIASAVVAVCHVAWWIRYGARQWKVNLTPEWVRFPCGPAVP